MSSLRELFVKVDIQDGATGPLNNINNMVNNLTQAFQRMGGGTANSLRGFNGINGEVARLTRNLNDSTREVVDLNRRLSVSDNEMRNLRTESQRMEHELRDVRTELTQITSRLNQAEQEARGLRQQMQQMQRTTQQANGSMVGLGSTLRNMVGLVGSVFAVHQLKEFAVSGIEIAASMQALDSQFSQVFGDMSTTAETNLNKIANDTSILPERLKGSFVQMAAFAKTTGADTADALSLAERATLAAADGAAFYDKSITDVTENLQSFLKGNFENDSALGISATEFTRNAAAADLFGKKFKDLSEQQKQQTLLKMVEDGNKLSGALGQAAREGDGFENVTGNLKAAWDRLKGTMMDSMLDDVVGGLEGLTTKISSIDAEALGLKIKAGVDGAVSAFNGLKTAFTWVLENKEPLIAGLSGVAAGFVTLQVVGTVNTMLKTYQASAFASTVATHGFNAALRANPIGLVVTAIGLLVAGGVALYRNWDTVKLKAGELWATTKEKFAGIKQGVSDFIQPAISWFDTLTGKWNNFKSAITNFSMPKWMSSTGSMVSGVIGKVKGFVDGSHATGLAEIKRDGYIAETHKGESILTASQSNSLRSAGILSANSDGTPNLDFSSLKTESSMIQPLFEPTFNPMIQPNIEQPMLDKTAPLTPIIAPQATAVPNVQISAPISMPIELNVQGNTDSAAIAEIKAVMQQVQNSMEGKVREVFESIFREKLAGMEG